MSKIIRNKALKASAHYYLWIRFRDTNLSFYMHKTVVTNINIRDSDIRKAQRVIREGLSEKHKGIFVKNKSTVRDVCWVMRVGWLINYIMICHG